MMFKTFIKNSFLLDLLFKWLKKQYVLFIIYRKGYYFAFENSSLQSSLIPLFRGYCIWKNEGPINISIEVGDYSSNASLFENSDLKTRYPNSNNTGYYTLLSPVNIPENKELIIVFEFPGGISKKQHTGWVLDPKVKQEFIKNKTEKLNRISEIFRCPTCESEELKQSNHVITCRDCGTQYERDPHKFNFLTGDLKLKGKVKLTENISAISYDEESLRIISEHPNGLILDNGSGLRGNYLKNVLNFEIVDYPTTDVTGIGEKLPFKDGVFDAAFSLHVLEHVKNPFLYANELKRVVKKGGIIYTVAPFLQPYHGFPFHFFNMTSEGLKVLFEDTKIIKSGEIKMGHPIYAISWILAEYLKGLSGKDKRRFSGLKVKDLIKDPSEQMQNHYSKNLSKEACNIISYVNFLVCEKI